MKWVLETDRLRLREMTGEDYADLCQILQDAETMYAYEHAFSDEEAAEWLRTQRKRYQKYGFGLWAAMNKETGILVGQAGLTMQPIGNREVLEIGYLLKREYWHLGLRQKLPSAVKNMLSRFLAQTGYTRLSGTVIFLPNGLQSETV